MAEVIGESGSAVTIEQVVGRNVRALREAGELSQTDLAIGVGVTRASISNLEAGRQNISVALLGRIADALSVSPGELLREAGASARVPLAGVLKELRAAERHARRGDVRAAEAEAREAQARAHLLIERAARVKAEAALDDLEGER